MLEGAIGDGVAQAKLEEPGVKVPVLRVRNAGPFSGYASRRYMLEIVEGPDRPVKFTLTIV